MMMLIKKHHNFLHNNKQNYNMNYSLKLSIILVLFAQALSFRSIRNTLLSLRGGSSQLSVVKLIYFDARGAAELSRVLLKIGAIDFEDYRYPIKIKEGGGFDVPEFTNAKSDGSLSVNMDRAPILVVNGENVGQSRAIELLIAKMSNMMGSTDIQSSQIQCIVENVKDIKEKWGKIRMTGGMAPSPEKEAATAKWFGGELSEWLGKLERSLPVNINESYTIGDNVTYADVAIWNLLKDTFIDNLEAAEKSINASQRLKRIADNVDQLTSVQKWMRERPKSMF